MLNLKKLENEVYLYHLHLSFIFMFETIKHANEFFKLKSNSLVMIFNLLFYAMFILLSTLFLPLFFIISNIFTMSFIHSMHRYFKLIKGVEENK